MAPTTGHPQQPMAAAPGAYPPPPGTYAQPPGSYQQQPDAYAQQPIAYASPPSNYPQAPGAYPQKQPAPYPQQYQQQQVPNVVYQQGGLTAPLIQTMDMNGMEGVVVRQVFQGMEVLAQAAGVPYEQANRYKVSAAPPGVHAASDPKQATRWKPSAQELEGLPGVFAAVEESSCLLRAILTACGGLNLRAFRMHFLNQVGHETLLLDRPCKYGGCCGCPLELSVIRGGVQLGRVQEVFDPYCSVCCTQCCQCIYHDRVMEAVGGQPGQEQHVFTIRSSLCCCGRVNNCCGATCCKDILVLDILDSNGKIVGHIQKTYGGSGCAACCRMALQLNNWLLDFPPGTTEAQKALLLGALMHVNYARFEKSGGDDDN